MLNNRLSFSLDFYNRETTDLFLKEKWIQVYTAEGSHLSLLI